MTMIKRLLQPFTATPVVTPHLVEDPIPVLAASVASLIRLHRDNDAALCLGVGGLLAGVVRDASWMPRRLLKTSPYSYRREVLFEAPGGSFSIGCFIWAQGQRTPIHDQRSWGVIGVTTGTLERRSFVPTQDGRLVPVDRETISAGAFGWMHSDAGEIHQIGAEGDETAVSIHVYGCRFDRVCWRQYDADGTMRTP